MGKATMKVAMLHGFRGEHRSLGLGRKAYDLVDLVRPSDLDNETHRPQGRAENEKGRKDHTQILMIDYEVIHMQVQGALACVYDRPVVAQVDHVEQDKALKFGLPKQRILDLSKFYPHQEEYRPGVTHRQATIPWS